MINRFLFLFLLSLFFAETSYAGTRVYKILFDHEIYYAVVIYPQKENLPIFGYTRLNDIVLPPTLRSGRAFDQNFEAVDYLFREGNALLDSADIIPIDPTIQSAVQNARVPHELAQAAELYLQKLIEAKIIGFYKTRKSKIEATYFDSLSERDGLFQDGTGQVAIFNAKKEVVSALAYSVRTEKNPLLPTERIDEVDFGDLPLLKQNTYPVLTSRGIIEREGNFLPILTQELKRFGIDRRSKVDFLPVLIYFGDLSGLSQFGAPSLTRPIYKGRPITVPVGTELVVGRYVIAGDLAAASIYQSATEPYGFTQDLDLKGNNPDNHYLHSERRNFIGIWERANRPSKRRSDGRLFILNSKISGFMVGPPNETDPHFLAGNFPHRPWHLLKKDFLKIPSATDCLSKLR